MPPALFPLAPLSWEFFEPRSQQWLAAQVPGCVHLDLRRHDLIPDPFYGSNELGLQWIEREDWHYRAAFDLRADAPLLAQDVVDLVADGLDTLAILTLNDQEVARTENMFTTYRFPVKHLLRPGRNELAITFGNPLAYIEARRQPDDYPEWNDPVGGCARIRKEQCSFGWDWGPRFATAGVYRDIRLEGWSGVRLEHVAVRQEHGDGGRSVTLHVAPVCEYAPDAPAGDRAAEAIACRLLLDGRVVTQGEGGEIAVPDPRLWWPNGHGAQPLYTLEVDLLAGPGGPAVASWTRRIGLRTVVLDRHADEFGESFQFVVNGKPVFAKGANWIPAHSYVSAVTHADYDDLLTSAADVHMNMIRIWGGGIYESEEFYDLCDEKGLLVWQDFMFACALYPGTDAFAALVATEAKCQVRRLAHRACLALWCGNNEIEQMPKEIGKTPERAAAYERIFYDVLPAAVAAGDGVTPYWPSSPHTPLGWQHGSSGDERRGDSHFWEVWHGRAPVKKYEEKHFRFCSEFGMQSYSSPEVAETFCPPEEFNIFSPAMENHQKNSGGNATIAYYLSRLYRFPKDYATLAYLSQLNQAYCLKVGIEHFRRSMPRTMGALYWQINDCWPVFSWSSIEFGGKWKALHHAAKRFFAPALVSAHLPGDEHAGMGNYLRSTIHEVNLFTVYDGEAPEWPARLGWELRHLDGRRLDGGEKDVRLRSNESICQQKLDFAGAMAEHGAAKIYLRIFLTSEGRTLSEDTVFLTAPRNLNLPRAPIEGTVVAGGGAGEFDVTFRSAVFQHRVNFRFEGIVHREEDNFFDLYPGQARTVRVRLAGGAGDGSAADLQGRLRTLSLADSY